MAVTAVKKSASGNRVTWLLAQDGTGGATLVMTNAVIQAACVAGPLKDAFNAVYVTDGVSVLSAIQSVIGGGVIRTWIQPRTPAATGGATEDGGWAVFADTDAVSTTKPELNIAAGVVAADAWLVVEYLHSLAQ